MDQITASKILRIAHDLLDSDPEYSEAIVKNLRGFISSKPPLAIKLNAAVEALRSNSDLGKFSDILKGILRDNQPPGRGGKSPITGGDPDDLLTNKLLSMIRDSLMPTIDRAVALANDPDTSEDMAKAAAEMISDKLSGGLNLKDMAKAIEELANDEEVEALFKGAEAGPLVTKMVRPDIRRGFVASLVKVAYENPEARPILLPIIAAKVSKGKPAKKSSKVKSVKASPKKIPAKKSSAKPAKKSSAKPKSHKPVKASPKKKPMPKRRRASVDITVSDALW
jgi:hypothetical protein